MSDVGEHVPSFAWLIVIIVFVLLLLDGTLPNSEMNHALGG
jgi:hypothetical protein